MLTNTLFQIIFNFIKCLKNLANKAFKVMLACLLSYQKEKNTKQKGNTLSMYILLDTIYMSCIST